MYRLLITDWRSGHPPHVGWWEAGFFKIEGMWRWWDGRKWSVPVNDDMTAVKAASLAIHPSFIQMGIYWNTYWPTDAQVPRINPNHLP